MSRKTFISLVATAALAAGIFAMVDDANAHRRHYHHGGFNIGLGFFPFYGAGYGYGYPGYGYSGYGYRNYRYRYPIYDSYDYDDYVDCRYRRVAVKKWNKAHTRRVIVYKKKRVCY